MWPDSNFLTQTQENWGLPGMNGPTGKSYYKPTCTCVAFFLASPEHVKVKAMNTKCLSAKSLDKPPCVKNCV